MVGNNKRVIIYFFAAILLQNPSYCKATFLNTYDEVQEYCNNSPCYYTQGKWYHSEPESNWSTADIVGVTFGGTGIVLALGLPIFDRLWDWVINKYFSPKLATLTNITEFHKTQHGNMVVMQGGIDATKERLIAIENGITDIKTKLGLEEPNGEENNE